MDTDSLIINIKTEYVDKGIANNVKTRFDISNYKIQRLLPIGKNKKVIGLMKYNLGGKTMFLRLRPRTYSYLTYDGGGDKKAKGTKKCIIKQRFKFEDYQKYLY